MSGPTNQQNAKLDYLFNASYSMLSTVPSLSGFYMKQLQTSLQAFELKNHATLQKTSCSKCGTIKLPGINHKVEIKQIKKNSPPQKKKTRRKNQLVEKCLVCKHVKIYHGSQKMKLPKDIKQAEQQKQQIIPEKKKKNKKKNNLQALLSKQQEQKQPKSGGSLNDFLSSL